MTKSQASLITAMLLFAATSGRAQTRSPVQDLLATARTAINDLRYADADSITSGILAIEGLRRSDRIQALQLSAGALFPEQVPAQKRDRAFETLRNLVRIAPSAAMPREVSWPGLEALHREARLATFGVSASPRDRFILTGPAENAEIDVATSRGAQLTLRLEPASGGPGVLLDSIPIVDRATLRFRVLADNHPRFPSGDYRLVVSAVDNAAPDTIRLVYSATILAPPPEYVAIPSDLETTSLLPERTRPRRVGGALAGALAMVGTIALAKVFRDDPLKMAAGTDSRAVPVGILLGLGTVGGVFLLDKGAPIPGNIAANERTRAEHARRVADAKEKNAELLRNYRAEITLNPEPMP